jgi:hypothetical protein
VKTIRFVVIDRGSYLRVLVPGQCRVSRAAIATALCQPFFLPGDLERVMPSFRGRFQVTDEQATWHSVQADRES